MPLNFVKVHNLSLFLEKFIQGLGQTINKGDRCVRGQTQICDGDRIAPVGRNLCGKFRANVPVNSAALRYMIAKNQLSHCIVAPLQPESSKRIITPLSLTKVHKNRLMNASLTDLYVKVRKLGCTFSSLVFNGNLKFLVSTQDSNILPKNELLSRSFKAVFVEKMFKMRRGYISNISIALKTLAQKYVTVGQQATSIKDCKNPPVTAVVHYGGLLSAVPHFFPRKQFLKFVFAPEPKPGRLGAKIAHFTGSAASAAPSQFHFAD